MSPAPVALAALILAAPARPQSTRDAPLHRRTLSSTSPTITVAKPDLACEVKVFPVVMPTGIASTTPIQANQNMILSGSPPRFTGLALVSNHGHKAATIAIGIITSINGVAQIGRSQTITVAAGDRKEFLFGGWNRIGDWRIPGSNELSVTLASDLFKAEQELNENNNGCVASFTVQTK
jgi:hypothetical protein